MKHLLRLSPWRQGGASVAALGLLLGGSSCYVAPGGPDYASVELSATDTESNLSGSVCTVLPVLLGSRALNEVNYGGGFRAEVFASADGADITFKGVTDPGQLNRFVSAETLRAGFAETLTINTTDGRTFDMSISSGCRE